MEVFIRAASCISPQQTFEVDNFPDRINIFSENKLTAVEPDYKSFLNPNNARRMSRTIKMGVCSALSCLKQASVEKPDAIIVGTGLGCLEDSEKFLSSLIENNEQTLSPTPFIFSTHNTIAGQIALLLQCNNYNFTHTNSGLSFENALMDGTLLLSDLPQTSVLVGGCDEVTDTSFNLLTRMGFIKREKISNTDLFSSSTSGTLAGEGSSFFLLSKVADENNIAKISAVSFFQNTKDETEVIDKVETFLETKQKPDLFLAGMNGDKSSDTIYFTVAESAFDSKLMCRYKHLSGDYHTSTAFACWLSSMILKHQSIPKYIKQNNFQNPREINSILIFNHYKNRQFSLILLERC